MRMLYPSAFDAATWSRNLTGRNLRLVYGLEMTAGELVRIVLELLRLNCQGFWPAHRNGHLASQTCKCRCDRSLQPQ